MSRAMRKAVFLGLVIGATSVVPAHAGVITSEGMRAEIEWTAEEQAQPLARRLLEENERESHWLIRLTAAEKPHTHEDDLTVFALKGTGHVQVGETKTGFVPGDVIRIPANVTHWATPDKGKAAEVYAIFSKRRRDASKA